MRYWIAAFSLLVFVQSASATNRGFMPGDAFFHSKLTQNNCEQLVGSKQPTLGYVRPSGYPFSMCGYAGYWKLQLPADSGPLVRNLQTLYGDLREQLPRELSEYMKLDGSKELVETNGFHIFVYNHNFDPLMYNLGLRYNENWVEDESSFGPRPSSTLLETFVVDHVAFSNDWRDAKAVPPLRTKCPAIPVHEEGWSKTLGNKRIAEPVLVDGQIQIIVTASSDLRSYFHRRDGCTFFKVTADGIKQYTAENKAWVVSDWTPGTELPPVFPFKVDEPTQEMPASW